LTELAPVIIGGFAYLALVGSIAGKWWFSTDQVVRRAIRRVRVTKIQDVEEGEKTRIVGRARGTHTLRAPLSGRACLHWRVVVEEYRSTLSRFSSGTWDTVTDDSQGTDFYIDDDSGSALVRAARVQVVLTTDARSSSDFRRPASPALERFLSRHGHSSRNKRIRYGEGIVEAGETVTAVGIGQWETDPDASPHAGDGYRNMIKPRRLVLESPHEEPILVSDEPELTRARG
jgi:hypothetical protein